MSGLSKSAPGTLGGALRLGQIIAWATLGLGFFLVALFMNLPASQVAGWLKLPLAQVQGSVWQGSAALRLPQIQLENVSWRVGLGAPWSTPLLADITLHDDSLKAQSTLGLAWNGDIILRDTQADMRLNHPLLAQRLPVPLEGTAHFKLASAQWSGGLRQAKDAQLELSELTLRMGDPLLLGSFIAHAEVQNGMLNTSLRDMAGALQLQGEIKGNAASGVSLQARAEAKPGAPAALLDTLNLLPAAPGGGVLLQTRVPAPWLARAPE
jgi:hypothetical protein